MAQEHLFAASRVLAKDSCWHLRKHGMEIIKVPVEVASVEKRLESAAEL
jgi:hypothetical protein